MSILISIIVPVYNVEHYLDRCVQSLINQTHEHLEIILIDDGSTDISGTICDKYALKDSRIKVYHIDNGGSSIARNYGLTKCKGDFIGFVDSDDWVMPDMFKELLKFAVDNNLEVVETSSKHSHLVEENTPKTKTIVARIEEKNTALKRIIKNKRFAVWRRLYHRSILKNRYFIEDILHQDVYFTIDILNEISHIGYFENEYYMYNVQNPTSVIRSDYSIKKLKSINAAAYVVDQTSQYDDNIQNEAKKYLFEFLTYHYNSLYFNPELDKDGAYRSNIRKKINKYHNANNFDFYSYAIINLTPSLYKMFLFTNKKRIKIQSKMYQFFKNV